MTGAPQEWASAAGEPREDQEVNDAALTGLNAEAGLFSKGQANLTKNERELYRWILTSFGAGRQPGPADFSEETERLQLDLDQALERMEAADLIRRDPESGAVLVAYPFSALPTLHTLGHVPGARALASSCCPVTNFFASPINARDDLAQHSGIDGRIVSIAQAADAGRALFGQLLTAQ